MRLDKYLASVTDYSRSQIKKVLKDERVTLNGEIVADPALDIDEANCDIELDGELLRQPGFRYFMLHKPQGYISATKDKTHPTVIDLLSEDNLSTLHIAGRLDIDTTGLVLITDDGQWSHHIISPKSQCDKTYHLTTAEPMTEKYVQQFAKGIFLHSEKKRCLPAALTILEENTAELMLQEGKYHQVKRMLAAMGNAVVRLHRHAIGKIVLDPDLQPGEYRPLTDDEVASVLSVTNVVKKAQ
jgi:16S rRNA pseudouridine516 synthase